jgi:aromatic-L-amino-acid decarboxylase
VDRDVRRLFGRPLPEKPSSPTDALDTAARILDSSIAASRPRYFAFVGSSGLEIGVLGDALAAAHDVNVAVSAGAADLVEREAVSWVAKFVGFPGAGGLIASGGMISNLTALCAARERAAPGFRYDGPAGRTLALYCSADAHYSVRRAAEVLGIGARMVRSIPVGADRKMDVEATASTIDRDRSRGVLPMAVVATAGTTLTGAVDDIAALADVCAERGVWLHVDGAYGLPAAATSAAGWRFVGLHRVDSATVDAHKWLFVPKACSVLLVRDPSALEAAFAHREAYLPHLDDEEPHAVDRTLEYSRPLRSLKLWLAFNVHGAAAIRGAIEQNLRQARLLAELVEAHPNFELVAAPQLSAVCFRHLARVADIDAHNLRLARALQADGRIYLAPAAVDGIQTLRVCIVNYRTTENDIRAALEIIEGVGSQLAA